MDSIEDRFLNAMQQSYQMVLEHGVRSNKKTKVLHGWAQDEMKRALGSGYVFTGQTPVSKSEANVAGMYYGKNVDILVSRDGKELSVISIKYVISNYWQNAVNYFEQQVGETANFKDEEHCLRESFFV
ncbi:MAG: hypothetical protein OXG02_04685 [Chloroflexi bacterium]|nr:hypothetical protein [Chloroflexota bacterium]